MIHYLKAMANDLDTVLRHLCEQEEKAGCYNVSVAGIRAYNIVRFHVRNFYLHSKGLHFVESLKGVNYWHFVKSFFLSTIHLTKLWILHKKYDTLFYPFLRLDNVDGTYVEKFTDPVIESCGLKDGYVIFERGWRGEHPKPRIHQSKVVYTNLIDVLVPVYTRLMYKRFVKKHRNELNDLYRALDETMEGVDYHRYFVTDRIFRAVCYIHIFERIFKRMGIKKIMGPSRANLIWLTYAAHQCGIKVYEFQHGITYGETALYSGYRDPDFTPDCFLAYGDTPPRDVYGIEEDKMINIGWAFQDYLKKLSSGQKKYDKGVLVISNPCTTDKVLEATFRLADAFKEIHFVVRPHPVEVVTQDHINAIAKHENVTLQDWHINVALAMQSFDCIIGESSTVLYEALNDGKKVARFCFEGFTPEYLTPEDEDCFWKVNDIESFKAFMDGKVEDKKSMKIYSKFDKELFLKLYNA